MSIKKLKIQLPKDRSLNEFDIQNILRNFPNFKGIFMRNNLPKNMLKKNECAIINLDDSSGPGTHLVAYYKKHKNVYYFDSFGNLPPPLELIMYLGSGVNIYYNYKKYQDFNTVNCGQLCINFLYDMNKRKNT